MSAAAELQRIAGVLLDEWTADDALRAAADDLYALFCAIAPPRSGDATLLPAGKALAAADAATCILDAPRTAAFLRGVAAAIAEARRRFRGEAIEVVYAGCGPFAALAVPLLPRLRPRDVRFTFIDVHAASIESLTAVLAHFGFGGFARALIAGDATRYRHDGPLHLVISETMQRALTVEPQVAIARNLAAQLHPRGLMVPRRVEVDLVFGDVRAGRVFALTAAAARRASRRTILRMPAKRALPAYRTRIRTYGPHRIAEGASGLTAPEFVWDLSGVGEGERIAFWYECGPRPGMRFAATESPRPR